MTPAAIEYRILNDTKWKKLVVFGQKFYSMDRAIQISRKMPLHVQLRQKHEDGISFTEWDNF